jgi:hypothetical protein
MQMMTGDQEITGRFPVGYHPLHPNVSLNFQLNRFHGWANEELMLKEMRTAAPRIADYADSTREMLALSDTALSAGRHLPAAHYARAAQFFLRPDDPRYAPARQRFLDNAETGNGVTAADRHQVPYGATRLTAYRFTPDRPRGTIVVFGGYDSYIAEWLPAALALRDAGLDTVIFDGPGQGTVLDAGTPMTPDWHLPVASADWFLGQGKRVMGAATPAEVFKAWRAYRTDDVSHLVTQDVLLLAGAADHYVPPHMLGDQILTLNAARSLSARVFTEAEHAHNHCQIGNQGLALQVILDWLDQVGGRTAHPAEG